MTTATSDSNHNDKEAQETLASLTRVSHKLALTTDRFEFVLDKLLPKLLQRIGENATNTTNPTLKEQIHMKLMEIFGHVMKRVKEDQKCQLPCAAILQLLLLPAPSKDDESDDKTSYKYNPQIHSMTLHLALAFLALGVPRCEDPFPLLPFLVVCQTLQISTASRKSQSQQLAHLLLHCLSSTVKQQSSSHQNNEKKEVHVQATRQLIQQDETLQATLFDLFLDVLLYPSTNHVNSPNHTTSSSLPPPGLSQVGHERLREQTAHIRSTWQTAVLEWISPQRKAILMDSMQGRARTICLLVVASSSPQQQQLSAAAQAHLKQYLESFRGTTGTTMNGDNEKEPESLLLGDPFRLVWTLLALCLGQSHAESTKMNDTSVEELYLGRSRPDDDDDAITPQLLLSIKRRPLTDHSTILAFVSTNVLTNHPRLFRKSSTMPQVVNLALHVVEKTLDASVPSSGLSTLRAKPYTHAAELLHILAIRLTSLDDDNHDDATAGIYRGDQLVQFQRRIMLVACRVLTPASTSLHTSGSNTTRQSIASSDGNVAIRDACYGTISTLCRSSFALLGYIYSGGDENTGSVQTASMLFGCAAHEEEKLKPRAVAALDALLGSYIRLYNRPDNLDNLQIPKELSNPWASMTPSNHALKSTTNSTGPSTADRTKLLGALLPLVWTAALSYQPKASRVAAARWAAELLQTLERSSACHLLCFLAGDNDPTAANMAREGLGLSADFEESEYDMVVGENESSGNKLADFGRFVSFVFQNPSQEKSDTLFRSHYYDDFSCKGQAVTLHFGMRCLLNDFYGGSDDSIRSYLDALTRSLASFKAGSIRVDSAHALHAVDLLDVCSSCMAALLCASKFAREYLVNGSFGMKDLQELAVHVNSSRARRYLAKSCGVLLGDFEKWGEEDQHGSVGQLELPFDLCLSYLSDIGESRVGSLARIHGSIFLGAYAIKALRKLVSRNSSSVSLSLSHKAATVLAKLGNGCMHSDELVGNACSDGILIAFHFDDISVHLDTEFCRASIIVLTKLAEANAKYSHTDSLNAIRTLKCAAASGACLAATTYPQRDVSADVLVLLHSARRTCIESLVGLLGSAAFRNEEEIAIGVGDALGLYADAYNASENDLVSHALKAWPETYDEGLALEMSPADEVLYVLLRKTLMSSSPHTRTSVAPALLAITARAARKVNSNQSNGECLFVRVLTFHVDEIQATFINLLSDPKCKHLSRESCCLGLAACRGLIQCQPNNSETTQELNNKLLRAFGQTTSFAGSALVESQNEARERRAAVEGQSETAATGGDDNPQIEVGGASGITEAALGAYKEMASAAVSLDRHDILYTLLVLSVSHPFWFTFENRNSYSSTALLGDGSVGGTGSGTTQIKEVLQPHLDKLLPRILRAKHDPNPQTREQMSALWIALTGGGAEARASISKHLIVAIDALLIETSSKMWRIRAGACSALAEIIVGRDWGSLGGGEAILNDDDLHSPSRVLAGVRMLRLWRVTMRALDDVRTNVRESGATLARAVRGLTIRLCDPSSNEKDSGLKRERDGVARPDSDIIAASATALRWLVRHGLNQHTEGTSFCITCLVEIVGLVTPRMLAPILPDLLRSLLVSISGLEPAALNYLQLRTDDQEGLERARLQLASTGPIASAVTKCLDLTPETSLETQHAVVVQLDNALRQSAGFATRSAIADAISTLCSTCPAAFQFSGTNSSNPSVRLLRALYNASERERTVASRDRLIHSLGSLASVCPGLSVRELALKACQKYNSSTGSNDDPVARSAAAASLRAIAVRASNQLADGGKMDIWCRYVLPSAFIGKKDDNKKIASQWQDVWDEAASALRSSEVPLIGTTHEENLLSYLVEECIRGLEDVSWSRRTSASNALVELCDSGILAPLPKQSAASPPSSVDRQEYRRKYSRIAMERCVLLVRRPRLWTGKMIAVTAASKIAGAWAAHFGDERDGQASTLTFTSGSLDDLFQGDKWFLAVSNNNDLETEDVDMVKPTISEDEENESDVEMLRSVSQLELSSNLLTYTGLCRLWLDSALASGGDADKNTESLPYRKACLDNLQHLLSKLPSSDNNNNTKTRQTVFALISPRLMDFIREQPVLKEPPVLVAAGIGCLESALYDGFGSHDDSSNNMQSIVELMGQAGGEQQAAWTVRESSAKCLARLVSLCHTECFRTYDVTFQIVTSASYALTDKKFWQVRHGGLSIFQILVNRAAGDTSSTSMVFEALLPHKETIVQQVRACLRDSESRITALASDILSSMAWWP